ncbi:hypothetical protein Salat_1469700 [Sesamum alatum]|uniref:Uncharacterized protein n=1 Tax=Sesamum alatum TaxID=300844 RepID=A0AAE2CLY9_9LAMI|nr:hypothetical protein Salat_1469700 [Sesamum alatum]
MFANEVCMNKLPENSVVNNCSMDVVVANDVINNCPVVTSVASDGVVENVVNVVANKADESIVNSVVLYGSNVSNIDNGVNDASDDTNNVETQVASKDKREH